MTKPKRTLLLAASLAILSLLSGCASMRPQRPAHSSLPWARPAAWENQSPGASF